MIYLLYKTNGEVEEIDTDRSTLPLARIQDYVGGYIEPMVDGDVYCYVNEDGLQKMLPRNPFYPKYVGNIIAGKLCDVETNKGETTTKGFFGFDDKEEIKKYQKKIVAYPQELFRAGKVFTQVTIGDFVPTTFEAIFKSTGSFMGGQPIFTEDLKGSKAKFFVRNLEDSETLLFSGRLPFEVETGVIPQGKAMFYFRGDMEKIKDYVQNKNLNPFFTAHERVCHLSDDNKVATLLFK